MGIVRKAVIGSVIVGLGAAAVNHNKKARVKIKKAAAQMGNKIARKTRIIVAKTKSIGRKANGQKAKRPRARVAA